MSGINWASRFVRKIELKLIVKYIREVSVLGKEMKLDIQSKAFI